MKTLLKIFQNKHAESDQLQPWDTQQMTSMGKKLKVSPKELNDAIIDTGSLDLNYIRAYLRKRGVSFSFKRLAFPGPGQYTNY